MADAHASSRRTVSQLLVRWRRGLVPTVLLAVVLGADLSDGAPASAAPALQSAETCTASTGPYQWQVEHLLNRPRDGSMSRADCRAIQRAQKRLGIKPADGAADKNTFQRLLSAGKTISTEPPAPHVQPRPPAGTCRAGTGPYQWQLEKRLKLPQDGAMSQRDCLAIQRLQKQLGIKPANGAANQKTYRLLLVNDVKKDPNARRRCPVRRSRVTCVDLSRQVLWVQIGRKVVFGPVPIRSGREGLETRTGWQRVFEKRRTFFSTLYDGAPMPYSQFFNGGQALHGTYKDLFESGSGGCLNMYVNDAKRLYGLLTIGDRLFVYGRKHSIRAEDDPSELSDDALIAKAFGSAAIPVAWDLNTPLPQP
ncbi:L,D-transpeptidase [Actinomycetota bacterium Odt1-20B]